MGGAKSKPKELGQRSRSLDDGTGGHHSSPNQSSFTPNRSPPVDGTRRGTQPLINAEQALFGGVISTPNSITSPQRGGMLAGNAPRSDRGCSVCVIITVLLLMAFSIKMLKDMGKEV